MALTHLVATFDDVTGRKLYINGQLAIEEDVPNDTLAWTDDARHKVKLGSRPVHTWTLSNEVDYIKPKARVY